MSNAIFNKGDKVWSFSLQEWGKVIAISNDPDIKFVVEVTFKNCNINAIYTIDGKLRIVDKASDLYFKELQAPKLTRPLRDKDIVLCWKNNSFNRIYRFYDAEYQGTFTSNGLRDGIKSDNMEYVPDNEAPAQLVAMRSQLKD